MNNPVKLFQLQKKDVINLLKKEKHMTRKCLLKRLGFKPDLSQLERDGVIRQVPGTNQYELVPEALSV